MNRAPDGGLSMDRAKADSIERAESPEIDSTDATSPVARKGSRWKDALIAEVRSHPFGYGVLAVALLVGPFLITMIFPEVTPVQAVIGGIAFGVYGALCAVPQKFM
jgi:hypothetical protein